VEEKNVKFSPHKALHLQNLQTNSIEKIVAPDHSAFFEKLQNKLTLREFGTSITLFWERRKK
jgi:hypothetical protein